MSTATPITLTPPAKTPRLHHVDALRGLMLVMMAVDHIPSDLQIATNHIFGYVSAAEGFVFLSGLMAGWVYSRHRDRAGETASRRKIRARALTIYRTHLFTYAALFAWCIVFTLAVGAPPDSAPPLMVNQPWAAVLMGPALLYQPGLLDVLPMYCLFLFALPALLTAFERGRQKPVIAGSLALWLLTNLFQSQQPVAAGWINLGAFNLGAWQLVFVLGVFFGSKWSRGQNPLPPARPIWFALLLPLAAGLWAIRHGYLPVPWRHDWFIWLTNKNNFAPLRLVNAAIIAWFIAVSLRRFPQILHVPPLALLGRNSLQVFAAHVVVAGVILTFYQQAAASAASRWFCTGLILGSMVLTALIHESWQRRARRIRAANSTLASPGAPSIV